MSKNLLTTSTSCSGPFTLATWPSSLSSCFKTYKTVLMPEIEKVIFQKEHTIIVWADGERTVVRCSEEEFDKEKGLAMAIAKRFIDRNKFKKLLNTADKQEK